MGSIESPEEQLGIVCPGCKAFNEPGQKSCAGCGESFLHAPALVALVEKIDPEVYKQLSGSKPKAAPRPTSLGPEGGSKPVGDPPVQIEKEPPMEQAQHYVCTACYTPVPLGHKFCGKCGAPTPFAESGAQVKYYGAMQVPGKARLILIKGEEGMDGISYHLNADAHVVGSSEGVILFASDPWVAPKHANFYYRDSALFVKDEGSSNGVFIRTRQPVTLSAGDCFAVGEQAFRFEAAVDADDTADAAGTYYFHSPWEKKSFRIVQMLEGGTDGMQVHDKAGELTIGRDDCDMNFYDDEYLSLKHVKVSTVGPKFEMQDLGSKNGTFLKIKGEQKLEHGDYVLIGKELLRVEIV